jgi:hypothetical protein
MECDLEQYERKVETIVGINLESFMGVNFFEGVKKPSQKNHLQINLACIGMLT